ncbi:hypothetical protein HWV07_00655 [Natronomonas salina]|uniref:HTH domain-containing protein n=1 Tax=Natronomonas salina TaxID=1710540 RepID=UPI0015B520D5|nr:HTH domain-containing protein [Natronomonas salina]QLD87622.1 hypothetical protein HWV07_00655 [Natronomonas salina]
MSEVHPDPRPEGQVTVDCYVRADAISDPVESSVAAVQELERAGIVDECTVRSWPSEVVVTPLTEGTLAVRRFRTFEEWAAQWGVYIDPPFRRTTRSSDLTGETREVLRTPAVCLAVYVDGRLREVFPHRSEETTYSVADAVETLRSGALAVDESVAREPSRADHCPTCDVPLSTGQGLYACPDCGWAGIATGRGAIERYDVPDKSRDEQPDDTGRSKLLP